MVKPIRTGLKLAVVVSFVVSTSFVFQGSAEAQLSESQLTQFASDDTVLAFHINTESLLRMIDKDAPDYKYIEAMMKEQAGYEFGEFQSALLLFGTEFDVPEDRSYFDPTEVFLIGVQWQDEFDTGELVNKWFTDASDDFVEDDIEGFDFYRHEGDYYVPSILAPNERSLILGREDIIRKGFEGLTKTDSMGAKIVQRLDLESDSHFVLDLSQLDEEARLDLLDRALSDADPDVREEYLDHVIKAEVTLMLTSNQPLTATVEMDDEEHAEKLKSIIKTGLMMAPGAIDMGRDSLEVDKYTPQEMVDTLENLFDKAEEVLEHVEIERDGKVVSIKIVKMGGFPEATDMLVSMYAAQMRMFEKMMRQFEEMDFGEGMIEGIDDEAEEESEEDDGEKDDGEKDDGEKWQRR